MHACATFSRGDLAADDARTPCPPRSARRPASFFPFSFRDGWGFENFDLFFALDVRSCAAPLAICRTLRLVALQALSGSVAGGRSGLDQRSKNSHRTDVLGLCAHKRNEQLEVLDCILNASNFVHSSVSPFVFVVCSPRAGSGVLRIDPLHFLSGCRTRRLNQV